MKYLDSALVACLLVVTNGLLGCGGRSVATTAPEAPAPVLPPAIATTVASKPTDVAQSVSHGPGTQAASSQAPSVVVPTASAPTAAPTAPHDDVPIPATSVAMAPHVAEAPHAAAPPVAVAATPVLAAVFGPGVRAIAPNTQRIGVDLTPGQPTVLALASGSGNTSAYRVDGGGTATASSAYRVAALAAGTPDPEATLRAYDARFARLHHQKRYTLASTADAAVGDTSSYWVMAPSDTAASDAQVTARTAYVGRHCLVLVDQEVGVDLDARAQEMGQAFDSKIFPIDAGLFGAPVAGGRDPRVTILLSPQVDGHGTGNTLGYFTMRDLFAPQDAPNVPELAHSNQRLMLYVSSRIAQVGRPADYLGTLAHELQHLINATHKVASGAAPEATWLDEGLAMYAMQANGYGLDSNASVLFNHVAGYLRHPERYSLTHWDLDPDGSAYGAVYLFVTYLVDRYGSGILAELVNAADSGEANVEARIAPHGGHFDGLFQEWVAANLLDGSRLNGGAHAYTSISLRGTYGGRTLTGAAVQPLDLPGSLSPTLLPRSANYLLLRSGTQEHFDLGLGGAAASSTAGWLITP